LCRAEAAAEVLLANKAKLICLAHVNSRREHTACRRVQLAKISIEKGQQLTAFYWKPLRMRVVINKYKFSTQKGKSFYMFN
jgi:hypothetical protein